MSSEIKVDTISEKTSANGVVIDGVTLKDSKIGGTITIPGSTGTMALTSDISAGGLVHINTSTFSTASSHSIDNCFSATYTNYKILIKLSAVTGTNIDFLARLRVSSSDETTNYRTVRQMASGTAMAVATDPTGNDDWVLGFISTTSTTEHHSGTIEIGDTFASTPTKGISSFSGYYGGSNYLTFCDWANTNSTSYDGITFFPAS